MPLGGVMIVRTIVERLLRNRVLWRRLPNGVRIAVSPDAQLKYLRRSFDSDLMALARAEVNDESIVWDIGANCGTFTFAADRAKSRVAVEADPFLCALMRRSAERNDLAVEVINAAVTATSGEVDFSIARRGRAASHLTSVGGYGESGGERERIRVAAYSLDALLDRLGIAPTLVKIDVESAELLVLTGAARLLETAHPTLYIEVGRETEQACRALLERAGYAIESRGMNWLARPSD